MRNLPVSDIQFPPRLRLSRIPTPIELLDWLPGAAGDAGVEVYVKRDDLTGCGLSGNKVRKLDFLLAEAIARGCDSVITCGAVQSNHCRATVLAAAQFGMRTCLLLRGTPESDPDGNLFLDILAGADIEYITPEQYAQRDRLLAEKADALTGQGHRPCVIPEGGSSPLGIFGYVNCAREISYQCDRMEYHFTHLACATSSGGTQAGLVLGAQAYLPEVKVVGFSVSSPEDVLRNRVWQLVEQWQRDFEQEAALRYEDIEVIDRYVGPGYGSNVAEDLEMIRTMARAHGLLLDPVYTVKAFRGLCEEIGRGRFPRGSSVLFIHSGGLLGIFPRRAELLRLPVLQEAP